jgi:hypothetical protein
LSSSSSSSSSLSPASSSSNSRPAAEPFSFCDSSLAYITERGFTKSLFIWHQRLHLAFPWCASIHFFFFFELYNCTKCSEVYGPIKILTIFMKCFTQSDWLLSFILFHSSTCEVQFLYYIYIYYYDCTGTSTKTKFP